VERGDGGGWRGEGLGGKIGGKREESAKIAMGGRE